jgi:hypothetical protein
MNGKQMAQRIATTTIPMMVCSESDWLVIALLFIFDRSLIHGKTAKKILKRRSINDYS